MNYTCGLPKELVIRIQREFHVTEFVETGTYMGVTAKWAAAHFQHVTTVEASKYYYDRLMPEHSAYQNVDFVFGDSRLELQKIVPALQGPAMFWLDGHWSGENTYGSGDECPLLKEIRVIAESPHEHFIFIDDARLFLSPPPRPHARTEWPVLAQVFDAFRTEGRNPYVLVFGDVIVSSPRKAEALLGDWYQEAATQQLNEMCHRQQPAKQITPKPRGMRQLLAKIGELVGRA